MQPASHAIDHPTIDAHRQVEMRQTLLDHIPDAVCYKDCGGVRLECNAAYARMLGKPREEVIGRHDRELFGAEAAAKFAETDRLVIQRNEPIRIEEWITLPDGTRHFFETRKAPIRGTDGGVLGLLIISRDITGREQLERELNRTAERLALALKAGGLGVWDADFASGWVTWDEQIQRIYGSAPEQLNSSYQAWLDRVHRDDLARVIKETNLAMAGEREYTLNFRILRPDGTTRHLRSVGWLVRDAAGAVVRVVGTTADVTEQILAQQEIEYQAGLINSLLQTIPDTIYYKDLAGVYQLVNPPFARDLGLPVEQVLGRTDYDLFGREVADSFRANDRAALATRRPIHADEWAPQPDGEMIPFETIKTPHFGPNGERLGVIGVSRNITGRKRIEQALRVSEESYRNQFEHNSAVMLMVDPDCGQIISANHAAERFYGYPEDRLVGMPISEINQLNEPELFNALSSVNVHHGQEFHFRHRLADGSLRDVEVLASRIVFGGRPAVHSIVHDISARVRAERELLDQRNRLEAIIRGTNVGTWEWNVPTGGIVVNERWAEMLGYTLTELGPVTNSLWQRLIHPEDAAHIQAQVEEHFSGANSQYVCELRLRHRDGGWIWVLSSGRVSEWTADGQPGVVFGTHLDITQRRQFEEKLERAARIQREMVHISTAFVNVPMERQDEAIEHSLAAIGRLINADRAYLFSYHFAADEVSNTHEWCADGIEPQIQRLQHQPLGGFRDAELTHRAGRVFTVASVAALPIDHYLRRILEAQGIQSLVALPLIRDDQCTGFVGFDSMREERVWTDEEIDLLRVLAELYANFSARVAAERANRELQERLVIACDEANAAARAKSLFLGNMSHEIRTPLNAILGYSQIMEREDRSSPNSERLRAISRSGEHLLVLINDLLEQARSDGREITVTPEHFDFHHMLDDMRLMFSQRAEALGLIWELELAPDLPRFVHADQGKIRQILVNLIGNAMKFTHEGRVFVTASVLARETNQPLLLAVDVRDTGSGISAADLEHIFKPFEQSESGRRSGNGSGLGLFLSRRYVRAIGGEISVTSQLKRGSCFRFTFQATASTAAYSATRAAEISQLAPDQPPCRVLVVDDDRANTNMLAAMLEAAGFTTEVAESGSTALVRLARNPPVDLVLMDRRMPGMDGYETIRRLREQPWGKALPVLVVTASGFSEERDLALQAGADGYLPKPVSRARLFHEIERMLGVRFEYEAEIESPPPTGLLPSGLDLATIPEDLRQRFGAALSGGDVIGMRAALDNIEPGNPELAASLRKLVAIYDYDRLHAFLNASRSQQP